MSIAISAYLHLYINKIYIYISFFFSHVLYFSFIKKSVSHCLSLCPLFLSFYFIFFSLACKSVFKKQFLIIFCFLYSLALNSNGPKPELWLRIRPSRKREKTGFSSYSQERKKNRFGFGFGRSEIGNLICFRHLFG